MDRKKKTVGKTVKAEIGCPKLVPVFTICPCRSVNHYQNGSSQTEPARSKAIDWEHFCVKLLDTACVGEDKRGLKALQVRTVAIQCIQWQCHHSETATEVTEAVQTPVTAGDG